MGAITKHQIKKMNRRPQAHAAKKAGIKATKMRSKAAHSAGGNGSGGNNEVLTKAASVNTKALEAVMANASMNGDNELIWQHMLELKLALDPGQRCGVCGYASKKRSDVIRHVRCVHMKIRDFQCKICKFKCFGSSSLNQHVKSVHLKIKDFSCELCNYTASRGADINKHLRARHRIKTSINEFTNFIKRSSDASDTSMGKVDTTNDYTDDDDDSIDDEDEEVDVVNDTPPRAVPHKAPPQSPMLAEGAFINPAAVLKNITNQATGGMIKKEPTDNVAISTKIKKEPQEPSEEYGAISTKKAVVEKLWKKAEIKVDKKPDKKKLPVEPKRKASMDKKAASKASVSNKKKARKAEVKPVVLEQQQKVKDTKKGGKKGAKAAMRRPPPPILVKHGRQSTGGVVQTSAVDGMRCHVCNYACEQRPKLMAHFEKTHIRRSKDNLDYQCAHCDYVTPLKVVLKSHIIAQHSKK